MHSKNNLINNLIDLINNTSDFEQHTFNEWGWSIFYDHFKVVSQENKQSLFSGAPQNCKTILKGVIKYANITMISYIF